VLKICPFFVDELIELHQRLLGIADDGFQRGNHVVEQRRGLLGKQQLESNTGR
jgi:hypothetical protein